ncbi:MAG TPA: outer membrane beta-barrel protein [Thermoanaerobaculia bacterium]|jgi:opacity protein-like surface antigen|nr:outer membrane beta-barrel protein [Thermoanaerobaculia bacterium]
MVRRPLRLALSSAAFAAVLLLAPAPAALAQGAPGFRLGLSGGAMIPAEDQSDVYDVGWNAMLLIPINFGASPFGIRLDGAYSEMAPKSDAIQFQSGNTRIIDGTFDFVFGPHLGGFQPYVIGGVGIYDLRFRGEDVSGNDIFVASTTRFGWNVGGGFAFRVGGSNTHVFVEGRYTKISLSSDPLHGHFETSGSRFTLIPVNVGVIF